MRIIWGLVALAALVIVAPAGTRTADKPVPGGQYTYKKTLPKNPGWHSSTPPFNIVSAEVGKFGTKVRVGWTLETGSDCTGMAYGKKFTPPDGAISKESRSSPTAASTVSSTRAGRRVKI